MYDKIAHYYDLLHDDLNEDIEFVIRLAEESGGPILELGCGTGRLLIPLARIGHETTGLDGSAEMLAIAKTKVAAERPAVRKRASLELGDITDFHLGRRYGLVTIPYNTLMHLNPPALAFCLGNVRSHLKPGGTLFIDVDNPIEVHDPAQDGLLLLERTAHHAQRDETIVLMVSSVGDGDRQTRDTIWIVDASPADNGSVRRTVASATLHYYFAHQLTQIVAAAGLELIVQYGDYDRRPYNDQSPRLLMLAMAR
ncbi:MAG: class I SAM-dependent methyltransferase [Chloroflexota bacterium]|nr:MAG: class I SAM-dependent methyltransferase [Chloroflexota bacterium]